MPFISRRDIPAEQRRPFEKIERVKLRQLLSDPSISEERKADIRKQIERLKPSATG